MIRRRSLTGGRRRPRSKSKNKSRSKSKSATNRNKNGGYQIIRKLYSGNDGPVFLVRKNGQELVLKRYNYELNNFGMDASILIESTILNQIKGEKNLLQLKEIEYRSDSVDIFVEKMNGEMIELILAEPTVDQIRDYMIQILTGLVKLHSLGIIHNDIKPKNILFSYCKKKSKTELKIIDFGLAYLINFPYYHARLIQTTHHYTPPEYRDHREIGRISLNSDMFSLGIVFYYLINPDDFREYDYRPDYDYIFDPHQIKWKLVKKKIGAAGSDLLEQMIELNPDKRISSLRALQHPFLQPEQSDTANRSPGSGGQIRSGGGQIRSGGQRGGSDRRWEIPNLMSRDEYINRTNQEEFLDLIVEKSLKTKIDVNPIQKIPIYIWNTLYEYFKDLNLKFITLNYGIYLMLRYLTIKRVRQDQWEHLAFACLFISTKFNEYRLDMDISIYKIDQKKLILKYEKEIIQLFNWNFPIPLLLTKEVVLYDYFLRIIYLNEIIPEQKTSVVANLYHNYFMFELLSSLTYFSEDLIKESKHDLALTILSFKFPTIKHKSKLKDSIISLLKTKRQLFWIERELLDDLNIK